MCSISTPTSAPAPGVVIHPGRVLRQGVPTPRRLQELRQQVRVPPMVVGFGFQLGCVPIIGSGTSVGASRVVAFQPQVALQRSG